MGGKGEERVDMLSPCAMYALRLAISIWSQAKNRRWVVLVSTVPLSRFRDWLRPGHWRPLGDNSPWVSQPLVCCTIRLMIVVSIEIVRDQTFVSPRASPAQSPGTTACDGSSRDRDRSPSTPCDQSHS